MRVSSVTGLTLVPCVLVTRVLPTLRLEKVEGAFTSYQSFFENGSTLHAEYVYCQGSSSQNTNKEMKPSKKTYTFFFPPFLPLLMRLFFPTAILDNRWLAQHQFVALERQHVEKSRGEAAASNVPYTVRRDVYLIWLRAQRELRR